MDQHGCCPGNLGMAAGTNTGNRVNSNRATQQDPCCGAMLLLLPMLLLLQEFAVIIIFIILTSSRLDAACPRVVASYICELFLAEAVCMHQKKDMAGTASSLCLPLHNLTTPSPLPNSPQPLPTHATWLMQMQYAGQGIQEQGTISPVLDEQCALYGEGCGEQHNTGTDWRGMD